VESFIALTKGRWAAKDVQNACLNQTRLAVLSACQTGLGQTVEGGTISLARAFQKAGVDSVAMSLWNVEDEATRDLMTGFAARVRDGDAPSKAMRAAMLDTRKRFPAPRQWASFLIFSAQVETRTD
jgi:CHAT domain-containing protein